MHLVSIANLKLPGLQAVLCVGLAGALLFFSIFLGINKGGPNLAQFEHFGPKLWVNAGLLWA